ncbi:hypothetical protein BJP34_04315 [Moorena producens PAL-8-15-08-1]|uniref:Dynamin family protein n=1 Tax=Moorena producens PAL-8-15-08-1 TaxID=1458985 RepID=A0A1D8TMD6_9CYAN|nr:MULTISPECIES: hypothetical protein [Moorena]AOW98779.1 hypothetical protein BJP34_04315 [Moorena producens PAL-8-15-08-1]NEO77123.1 hypothetical protein [Moorena sp. SIO4G3]
MSKVEQLRKFNNLGESILNQLKEYDSVIQNQSLQQDRILTEISNQVEIVRKQAEEVVKSSSSPVKIAVMGEFKATKTTVLGSLLGYAGMLPDSRVAATGNVTHLNIVQVKGSQPTEFKFSVKYFNQNEIDKCLDFILEELVVQAEAQLPSTQIASLKNFNSKNPDVWQNIIQWYDEVKNYDKTPGLENAIQELVVFVESYLRYNNLCGQSLPIDNATHAYAGLQLPNDPRSILDIKKFEQFPPEDEEQFPKFLQATFPLIGRINVEVKVSDKIWDLSSLQEANKLVLLDLPGLGADKSELRDRFVNVHEMENVQTILLLTYGPRPGSTTNNEIIDLLRKQRKNQNLDDFILVGVGRFDDLPGAEVGIDKLLSNTEQLTEQKIFDEIPALRKVIENSRKLTKGNDEQRIVFMSAFAALEYLIKNLDSTIKIATPTVLENLNIFQKHFPDLNEKWQQLSERLKKSEPDSILVTWLDAFTKDGGLSRLRYLLENHVATHGLEQLYKDVNVKVQTLVKEQQNLAQKVNNPSLAKLLASENPKLRILRQALRELADSYKALKTHLEKNPLELGVGIDETRSKIPLRQEVEEKVNSEISRWSEWRTLFLKIENGIVNLPQVDSEDEESFFSRRKRQQRIRKSFTKSDELYPSFQEACDQLEKFIQERVDQSIKDWLDELSNNLISLKDNQRTINVKEIRSEIEDCVVKKEEIEEDIQDLLSLASPREWESMLLKRVKNKSSITIDSETLFPLPREDKNSHEPALIFGWSPDHKQANKRIPLYENHLTFILGLRDTMICSVSDSFIQILSKVNQTVNKELQTSILEEAIVTLEEDFLADRTLLKQMVGEEPTEETTPDWLLILQELVNIPL